MNKHETYILQTTLQAVPMEEADFALSVLTTAWHLENIRDAIDCYIFGD